MPPERHATSRRYPSEDQSPGIAGGDPPPPTEQEGVDPTLDNLSCNNGKWPIVAILVSPPELSLCSSAPSSCSSGRSGLPSGSA